MFGSTLWSTSSSSEATFEILPTRKFCQFNYNKILIDHRGTEKGRAFLSFSVPRWCLSGPGVDIKYCYVIAPYSECYRFKFGGDVCLYWQICRRLVPSQLHLSHSRKFSSGIAPFTPQYKSPKWVRWRVSQSPLEILIWSRSWNWTTQTCLFQNGEAVVLAWRLYISTMTVNAPV